METTLLKIALIMRMQMRLIAIVCLAMLEIVVRNAIDFIMGARLRLAGRVKNASAMAMRIRATRCAIQRLASAKIVSSGLMDFFARNASLDFSAMQENIHANVNFNLILDINMYDKF